MNQLSKVIRHVDNEWCIFSGDGSKKLACYPTKTEAVEREAEIRAFAHMPKSKVDKFQSVGRTTCLGAIDGPELSFADPNLHSRLAIKSHLPPEMERHESPLSPLYGFEIMVVDSEWVSQNFDVAFESGGQPLHFPFIPYSEIWIDPVILPASDIVFLQLIEWYFMTILELSYNEARSAAELIHEGKKLTEENLGDQIKEVVENLSPKEIPQVS